MSRAAVALLAVGGLLALAGCGGEDAPVRPELGLTAAEDAFECLDEEGFEVRGSRTPDDRDGADVEVTVRSGDVPILIAYYESEAEADRRQGKLFDAVAPQGGTVLQRGSIAIVTGGVPDADDKAAIEGCVF